MSRSGRSARATTPRWWGSSGTCAAPPSSTRTRPSCSRRGRFDELLEELRMPVEPRLEREPLDGTSPRRLGIAPAFLEHARHRIGERFGFRRLVAFPRLGVRYP